MFAFFFTYKIIGLLEWFLETTVGWFVSSSSAFESAKITLDPTEDIRLPENQPAPGPLHGPVSN